MSQTRDMPGGSYLGMAVKRTEDPRFITGSSQYVDDVVIEGALYAHFVRSPLAHAKIDAIDTSEAEAMPGVVAVHTYASLGLEPRSVLPAFPGVMSRPPLADGVVRFMGEAVAVVLAETRTQAADAAELVLVEYDPLDVVVDPERALSDDAPRLFAHDSNIASQIDHSGDGTALDGADVVARVRIHNQRLAAIPMEGNAIAVVPDGDSVLIWLSTQMPHGARDSLAGYLGLEADKVRVIAPDVGGGFGAKGAVYPEFEVVAVTARLLNRPVRWLETRSENLLSMNHGRGQIQDVEIGATADGKIVGLRVQVIQEAGAYPHFGAFLPQLTYTMASGVYEIPKIEYRSYSVVTNTTPVGAYRGAGRPEAAALVERAVDALARELGMDGADLRRKNYIAPDAFPFTTKTGAAYDCGEYAKALDQALDLANYAGLRVEQAARRERGDRMQLGIGLASYVEITGGGGDYAKVTVDTDGTVTVYAGTSSHGQGHETAYKQIAAELLKVPIEQIRFVQSDTALVARGGGTGGSRSIQIGGSAAYRAGENVVEKAKMLAAHLLEASAEDIVVSDDGRVGVAGVPAKSFGWDELAKASLDAAQLPEGMEPGLDSDIDYSSGGSTFPFGTHISVAEVDTETGDARLVAHYTCDDAGRIINPLLFEGQVHGGIAQGVAQALYEEVTYDEDGNPLNASLASYAMPSAAELPFYTPSTSETLTPMNALGAKGIGEAATIGATPAVQNAVIDAVAHLGITHIDMPMTPERVWRSIVGASSS